MSKKKVTPLIYDSYLALIKKSVGTRLFQNFYARVGGKKQDIMKNGDLSCAFFASSLLVVMGLVKEVHATVDGTVKDLRRSGWKRTRRMWKGSVIVWEKLNGHKHIGFVLDKKKAVLNSTIERVPTMHHLTFGVKNRKPVRRIEAVLWHPKLRR